jgi:hypothetical protein
MRFAFALIVTLAFATAGISQKNYEFKNGYWYNGTDFALGTWYTVDGKFSKKAPAKIDSVIDLYQRYVIPPFGDAFSSSLTSNPSVEQMLKMYFSDGIFYIQTLGNTQEGRKNTQVHLGAKSPDVTFANGEIACTLGEPFMRYEPAAMGIKNPNDIKTRANEIRNKRTGLGDGYWFFDDKSAINANWDRIKAQKPNVIAISLLDAEKMGGKEGKGLSPDVAKAVVKKAHKADLKVFARVENVNDIRLAIKLGIDGIAGLPGSDWNGEGSTAAFELTDADIKLLAKKKTVVIPVFSRAQFAGKDRHKMQTFQAAQLAKLLKGGVKVAVGSDDPQRTIRTEVTYWFNLGDLDIPAALKAICETTPQVVFPDRKVGRIEHGYEASFLVVDDSPYVNFLKMRAIRFKVKNGVLVP